MNGPVYGTAAAAVLAVAAGSFAATIHTDFEGGSAGRIDKVSGAHFRVAVKGEADQDKRNRQANWYYFRVDGALRAEEIVIDMVGLPGEYNYRPNRGAVTGDTPPLISYDRKTWTHITTFEYDAAEPRLRLRVAPAASTFWIAHTPPYTNEDLARLRPAVRRHADAREEVIGKTAGGRPLYLWTITRGSGAKKTIWLMFRQHSWESGSSWAGEGAVRALLETPEVRERFTWKIFPMCDPDGVARGGVRFNVNGYDLNRNWDAIDPRVMPEIAAHHKAVADWIRAGNRVDLFLTLHNTETSEYLQGPPGATLTPPARRLAERFFAALRERTTFSPSRPLSFSEATTTAGMKGRMTAVQGLWHDFRIPAFLIEQRIAHNPRLGRLPGKEDRLHFGRQLITAMAAALD